MIIYDYTYAYRYTLYLASLGRVSSSRWLIHRLRKHICRYQRGHFHGASQSHYKIRQWKIQCSSAFMNHYRNKTWKFTFKHHITKKCSHLHKNVSFFHIFSKVRSLRVAYQAHKISCYFPSKKCVICQALRIFPLNKGLSFRLAVPSAPEAHVPAGLGYPAQPR